MRPKQMLSFAPCTVITCGNRSALFSYLGEELWMEEKLVQLWESQRKDYELRLGLVCLGLVCTSFSTLTNSSGRQRHQIFQWYIVAAHYQSSMGG